MKKIADKPQLIELFNPQPTPLVDELLEATSRRYD